MRTPPFHLDAELFAGEGSGKKTNAQVENGEDLGAKQKKLARFLKEADTRLAATPTGRKMLKAREKLGIGPPVEDASLEPHFGGMCYCGEGKGPARVGMNPRCLYPGTGTEEKGMVFEIYVHELAHALADHGTYDPRRPPRDTLLLNRMDEAHAVAHTLQVGREMKDHAGDDSLWQFMTGTPARHPRTGKEAFSAHEISAEAYADAAATPGAVAGGTAMRAAFMARMVEEEDLNDFYNDRTLEEFETLLSPEGSFARKFQAAGAKEKTRLCRENEAAYLILPRPLKAGDLSVFTDHLAGNYLADEKGKMNWLLSSEMRAEGMPDLEQRLRLERLNGRVKALQKDVPEKNAAQTRGGLSVSRGGHRR